MNKTIQNGFLFCKECCEGCQAMVPGKAGIQLPLGRIQSQSTSPAQFAPLSRICRYFIMLYDTTWSVTQHLRKLACSSQRSELQKCLGWFPQICATSHSFLKGLQKVPLTPCLGFGAVHRQRCLCLPNPRLLPDLHHCCTYAGILLCLTTLPDL